MKTSRILSLLALLGAASAASAHTGHGTHSLMAGLAHPFGMDHLLAMLAVGVWSAVALPGARRWYGPVTFLTAMCLGALLGAAGLSLPGTELGIATSVAVFGAMLVAGARLPQRLGLLAVAAAAALHGLAHGAELPAGGSFAAYAAGFLLTTAALHVAGVGLGAALRDARALVWRGLGASLGAAGLLLMLRA
jgi:urease accessory protein